MREFMTTLLIGLTLAFCPRLASAASGIPDPVCLAIEPVLSADFDTGRRSWLLADEAASQVAWSANELASKLDGVERARIEEYFRHGRDPRLGAEIARRLTSLVESLRRPGGINAIRCPDGFQPEANAAPGTRLGLSRCVKRGSRLGGGIVFTTAPNLSVRLDEEVYSTLVRQPLWDREVTLVDTDHVGLPPDRLRIRFCSSLHPDQATGPELCHVLGLEELASFRRLTARDILVENHQPAAFAATIDQYLAATPRWRELRCRASAPESAAYGGSKAAIHGEEPGSESVLDASLSRAHAAR